MPPGSESLLPRKEDTVRTFLLAKGVECEAINTEKFKVREQLKSFLAAGGKIRACGTCLKIRHSEGSDMCPISTMGDLYEIVHESAKLLTF